MTFTGLDWLAILAYFAITLLLGLFSAAAPERALKIILCPGGKCRGGLPELRWSPLRLLQILRSS